MAKSVVGVRFKKVGKIYYFDPQNLEVEQYDHVIVETVRGVESVSYTHLDVYKRQPGLTSTLNHEGYSSYAIHPGERNAWNRDKVYPNFGFQQFFSEEEFMESQTIREKWVSDTATYDKVIELYENKGDNPLFVFDVTIQNHAGYQLNADDLEPVLLEGMEGSYPETEQYLSLMRSSDAAFKNLIDYFSSQDEPTLVVMFGDHQAYIEQAFYEELMQKPLDQWSTEELQRRYVTPFVIWANYDIPEAQVDKLSVNYLSSLLLAQAGIQGLSLIHIYAD